MGTRSAIFIQRGVEVRKQTAACIRYIESEHWSMLHVVPYHAPHDAVRLVRDGTVDVVVTAYDSRAAQALAADIGHAGRVIFVHPNPTEIPPPPRKLRSGVTELILRWWRRGDRSVADIAADVETDTTEIREILRRAGEHPDPLD